MQNIIDVPFKWLLIGITSLLVIFLGVLGFQVSEISNVNSHVSEMIQQEGGINGKSLIDIEAYLNQKSIHNITYQLKTYDGSTTFPDVRLTKYSPKGTPINALVSADLPSNYGLSLYGEQVGYVLYFQSSGGIFSIVQSLGGQLASLILPMKNLVVVKSDYLTTNDLDPYYNVNADGSASWATPIVTNSRDNFSWAMDASGNAHVWSANGVSPINFKDGTLALANNPSMTTLTFDSPVIGTNFSKLFYNDQLLNSIDLSKVDTSGVKSMASLFEGDTALAQCDLSCFDTSNVTDMSRMFYGDSTIATLDCSNFNTSNVTTMSQMFTNMTALINLTLSNFDTSNVTDMSGLFSNLASITELDVSNFDTSNVTNMSGMFQQLKSLTQLDLSSFKTSHVTNMSSCFNGDSGLLSLSLANWDFKAVTNLAGMFTNNSVLSNVDLTGAQFSTTALTGSQVANFSTGNSVSMIAQLAIIQGGN